MKFVAQECECCDEIAMGIEFDFEDLQRTEDGKMFLTMDRDDVSKVFTSIDDFIGGRNPSS